MAAETDADDGALAKPVFFSTSTNAWRAVRNTPRGNGCPECGGQVLTERYTSWRVDSDNPTRVVERMVVQVKCVENGTRNGCKYLGKTEAETGRYADRTDFGP